MIDVFSACFWHSDFPRKWRTASLILIPKPGKDPNLSEIFGQSNLSHTSKVFERLVQRRVRDQFQRPDILIRSNSVSGKLILGSSTDEANRDHNRGQLPSRVNSHLVFGREQAFDRVWHKGLLHKLREILFTDCNHI